MCVWWREGVAGAACEQDVSSGEQEESRCQRCISELKDIRLQLEACETRTVHRLRLPLDKEPARECAQRITEQQAGPVHSPAPAPAPYCTPPPAFHAGCALGSRAQLASCSVSRRKRRLRWTGWARGLPGSLPRPRRSWPCPSRHPLPPLCVQSWS